jgi:hypothetical protein
LGSTSERIYLSQIIDVDGRDECRIVNALGATTSGNRGMARRPSWKRADSPIGKKGPRKANPKYKRHQQEPWTDAARRELRKLAKANTPTGVISLKMGRTVPAIRSKAQREGISLAPSNRSPYNRRQKSAKR